MPRQLAAPGTVTEYVIQTLERYADRELRVTDLHNLAEGKFQKPNIVNALDRLHAAGRVVKHADGPREVWWAIA